MTPPGVESPGESPGGRHATAAGRPGVHWVSPSDYWFGGGVFLILSSAHAEPFRGGPVSAPSADLAESERRPHSRHQQMREHDPYDFHH
jgi:hypothetical protein